MGKKKKLIYDVSEGELEEVKEAVLKEASGVKVNLLYAEDEEVVGIQGRQELPPLGLLYVAGILRDCGVDTQVIPFTIATDPNNIRHADIQGYGITSTTVYKYFLELYERMQRTRKDILHVGGNAHALLYPEQTIDDLDLHGVLRGESEFSMLQLVRNFVRKGVASSIFENIPASVHRTADGKILRDPNDRCRIEDLDSLSFPARDLLPEELILLGGRLKSDDTIDKKLVTFITSRGCPFACAFCANLNNGSIRYRSKKNMCDEIAKLRKLYPDMEGLLVMDETATLDKAHVRRFTEAIGEHDLMYVLSTRADVVTPERLQMLKDSGCFEIKFGLETGSPELLRKMRKRLNLDKMKKGIRITKEAGIQTKVFLLHGFPGENLQTTHETIELLHELKPYIDRAVVYRFTPLPGSPAYDQSEKFDLNLGDKSFRDFTIYNNAHHWWGSAEDFKEVQEGYRLLQEFVDEEFRR